jgi:phage terminase large subunit-like protein
MKDDEDWEDEANWYKVNPSLGYTMEGKIIHGGHPVLRRMAGNVVVDTDPTGNIKVTKAKSKEKIDGIVAAIMALDRCIRNQTEPQESVYEKRGLLIL